MKDWAWCWTVKYSEECNVFFILVRPTCCYLKYHIQKLRFTLSNNVRRYIWFGSYWFRRVSYRISRYCLRADTSNSKLLGLALDEDRGLLYYTDNIQGIIAEITTNGSNRREIYSDASKHPRAIVVDSNNRWTKFAFQFWLNAA